MVLIAKRFDPKISVRKRTNRPDHIMTTVEERAHPQEYVLAIWLEKVFHEGMSGRDNMS